MHSPFPLVVSFFPPLGLGEGTKPQHNYLEIFAYEIWIWLLVYVIRLVYSTSHFNFLQNKKNDNLNSLKDGVQRILLEWRLWSFSYFWHFTFIPQGSFLKEELLGQQVWIYLILGKTVYRRGCTSSLFHYYYLRMFFLLLHWQNWLSFLKLH